MVLLPELADGKYAAMAAQKILLQIAREFTLIGQEFRVTASIGISTYPQDGLDEQTLTKNADIAMYQAKRKAKTTFSSIRRSSMPIPLSAWHWNRACDTRSNAMNSDFSTRPNGISPVAAFPGMEALLRWEHPDLGTLGAMDFIPVAEDTGLIIPIGKWVLKTACMQSVEWRDQGLPPLSIASI